MSAILVTKEPQLCSCPVYQAVQVKVGEAPIPEKNVIDQICSKAEPPELVGKVV